MQNQIKLIAERIRELRSISGKTEKEIAQACEVKESEYIAYETGEHDIPVGVLYSLAHHFKVELTALITGEDPHLHSLSLTKKGKGVEVTRRTPYKYLSLAHGFANRKGEPFLVTVKSETSEPVPELNTHPGQEFNFVLKGKIKFFHDQREYLLEEGDSVYYDSGKPHGMEAMDSSAEFLAIII